jgi:tetratricopeptide (TPR) repeat protein
VKKYIPNIIPEKHRILDEYFKDCPTQSTDDKWSSLLEKTAKFFFIIAFLLLFFSIWVSISLALIASIISPKFHNLIEKKLNFKYTQRLRLKSIAVLMLPVFIIGGNNYVEFKKQEQIAAEIELRRIEAEENQQKLRAIRKDSLVMYVSLAESQIANRNFRKSIEYYKESLRFTDDDNRGGVTICLGNAYFELHDYKRALVEYEKSVTTDAGYFYRKGVCYKKSRDTISALRNFKTASNLGHEESSKEYEKLNPMLKRVIAYRTRCCDGTYSPSNSKGRGACSHHSGVCNWNEPQYQNYRKYEVSSF